MIRGVVQVMIYPFKPITTFTRASSSQRIKPPGIQQGKPRAATPRSTGPPSKAAQIVGKHLPRGGDENSLVGHHQGREVRDGA